MTEYQNTEAKRVILAGVCLQNDSSFEITMQELAGLAEACFMKPVGTVIQKLDRPETALCMGSGKVQELKQQLFLLEADCVVFNNTLTPSQLSNLSKELDTEVLDKTSLILEIFGERARSKEAKMQVEYARLQYALPRLVGLRTNLSRQGGTGGSMSNKGSGEKQLELDRRHIEKRMAELRRELKAIEGDRNTQRRKRQNAGIPLAALVGYTNAGKSTLMNCFLDHYCQDENRKVMAKDMLFATLDTTIRRITPETNKDFLLSDTVGFISDLPHDLVKAFRSTLEEARLADLILEVVDYSDENYQMHMDVTEQTLRELEASHIPVIYIMNKADRKLPESQLPLIRGNKIYLSAKSGVGIRELMDLITQELFRDNLDCSFLIPYSDGSAEHFLRENAHILESEYRAEGIYLRCNLNHLLLDQYKHYLCI